MRIKQNPPKPMPLFHLADNAQNEIAKKETVKYDVQMVPPPDDPLDLSRPEKPIP